MAGSDDETTPPGWYRQKDHPGTLRWWDGEVWTDDLMPMPPGFGRAGRAVPGAPAGPDARAADLGQPLPRPRRPAASSGAIGSRRPGVEPAPTRIRTSPRAPDDDGSHLVRRGMGATTPAATVGTRALLIAIVLAVGYLGFTKLLDAEPGEARTLAASAPAVAKDGPDRTPLDKVVLTLSDLPRGWATQPFDPSTDDVCHGLTPRNAIRPLEVQSSSFTQGSSGPFMTNVVARFANEDTAKAFMALTARTVDSCRSYEANGGTVRLSPLAFPAFGDDTFVAKAAGTYADGPLEGDIIYVRVGNRVASIETIAFGDSKLNPELIEFLTRLVSRRM